MKVVFVSSSIACDVFLLYISMAYNIWHMTEPAFTKCEVLNCFDRASVDTGRLIKGTSIRVAVQYLQIHILNNELNHV